jgi:hypothetical protein
MAYSRGAACMVALCDVQCLVNSLNIFTTSTGKILSAVSVRTATVNEDAALACDTSSGHKER